ncbi:hypothetical protein [Marinobacter salexigens]|uniref:hypothetical protein n=1 Tax=Marinobacter salexigens TaxID=1925763 RepID=UPI000C284835|nr:hypothetical protein [Marinobacter salexigens]
MFQSFLDALIGIVLFIPRWLFSVVVDILELFLSWIPVIDMVDPVSASSGLGSDVLYFTTVMEVPYGLAAALSALTARFVLRRIPFIGG